MPNLKERVERVQIRMENAAKKSGRSLKDIALVAVTKGVAPEAVGEAQAAGVTLFGENKVQEALQKIPESALPVEWHMIGHLQTNKIRTALDLFGLIQSVDSVRLAEKINRECLARNKTVNVLLEVNISGEAGKYGFKPENLYAAIESMNGFSAVRILGLMGMAPSAAGVGPEQKREAFKKLRNLFGVCKSVKQENLAMKFLSMGMSDDFEIAIEEGANMIRLGRAIFSEEKGTR